MFPFDGQFYWLGQFLSSEKFPDQGADYKLQEELKRMAAIVAGEEDGQLLAEGGVCSGILGRTTDTPVLVAMQSSLCFALGVAQTLRPDLSIEMPRVCYRLGVA